MTYLADDTFVALVRAEVMNAYGSREEAIAAAKDAQQLLLRDATRALVEQVVGLTASRILIVWLLRARVAQLSRSS